MSIYYKFHQDTMELWGSDNAKIVWYAARVLYILSVIEKETLRQ